jgi:hypothetical protein
MRRFDNKPKSCVYQIWEAFFCSDSIDNIKEVLDSDPYFIARLLENFKGQITEMDILRSLDMIENICALSVQFNWIFLTENFKEKEENINLLLQLLTSKNQEIVIKVSEILALIE